MFFGTFSAVLSSLCFAPLMRAFRTFQIVPFIFTNHNRFRYTADVFHSEYSIFWKLLFAALSNSSVNDRFLHHAVVPVFYFSI